MDQVQRHTKGNCIVTITIKRAGPPDWKAVMDLRKKLYEGEMALCGKKNGSIATADEWRLAHDTLGFLLDPYAILLLAIDNELPIGMLAVQNGPTFGLLQQNAVSIVWAYIEPAYRAGEAYTLLARTAEKAVRQDKPVLLQAAVRAANTEVLDALKRAGYNPVAVILEKMHERTNERPAPVEPVHEQRREPASVGTGPAPN